MQTIKIKEVSFRINLFASIVGREKLSKGNRDSGSLRANQSSNSGAPSIDSSVGSATQHSPLDLLKQGIKKHIIYTRNS
jgi:hypothetical protein